LKPHQFHPALTKLDTIVLDKTGAITIGKPPVVNVIVSDALIKDEEELLRIGASVEMDTTSKAFF